MNSRTDQQLLRDYAVNRSEAAFRELVRRHVDLVYSAALRMVCDSHQAEDVSQGVFLALAQNAAQLTDHPILSAWLHRTTQNLAANAVRTTVRRQAREQEAVAMNELSCTDDASWEHIAPHLDIALGELSEPDRDAVMLRYFEKKSANEMAVVLGISAEAAQKRTARAVERLRELFAKRGVTVGAGALAVVIPANAVQAAPVGLVGAIFALAGSAVPAATIAATATKTIAMTTLQKALIAATVVALGGAGIYEAREARQLRKQVHAMQQQHVPLTEQIAQLKIEGDTFKSQVAALTEENQRLSGNSQELLKLRGEVAVLRNAAESSARTAAADASLEEAARDWVNRAKQLKEYVEQHPEESIPEFQFLSEREWLVISGDSGRDTKDYRTAKDLRFGVELLRIQAESKFGNKVQVALGAYTTANKGKFPTELSQLQPYCDPAVGELLVEAYEIKSSSVLPFSMMKENDIHTDWIITRKQPVNPNSRSRIGIHANGYAYWQSSP